jgi:hypothetical protein
MNGTPAIFSPYQPAAPWWNPGHATLAGFGWSLAVGLAAGIITWLAWSWLSDRYEVTCPRRVTRRWYGKHAEVRLRFDAPPHPDRPGVFSVLDWDDEHTDVPWLLAQNTDGTFGVEAFWAPVTDFVPHAVRRFRPHLSQSGPLRLPVLFRQVAVGGVL